MALCVPAANLSAQISSDRPGLGDGSHVVASGVWQVEGGVQLSGNDGVDVVSIGQGLIRWGLGALELRFFPNSFVVLRGSGDDRSGIQDFGVGVKVPLRGEGDWRWSLGATTTLPTGSDDFSAEDPTGAVTLIGETSLSDGVGVALNAGYAAFFDDVGDGTFSLLVTPSFSVPDVPGLSLYAGWAGYFGPDDDVHIVEGGLAKAVGEDGQWDINAGYDPDSGVWFLGFGASRRWR